MPDRLCKAGIGLLLVLILVCGGLAGCAQLAKDLDALSSASPRIIPDDKPESKTKSEAKAKAASRPGEKHEAKTEFTPIGPHEFKSDSPYLRFALPQEFKIDSPWPHEAETLVRAWLPGKLRLEITAVPRPQGETMARVMTGQRRKLKKSMQVEVGAPEKIRLGGLSGLRFGFELEGVSYLRYLLPDGPRLYIVTLARRAGMTREKALAYLAGLSLNPDPTGAAQKTADLSVRDLAYSFGGRQMDLAVKLAGDLAKVRSVAGGGAVLEVECLALRRLGGKFAGRAPQKVDWAEQRVRAWRGAKKNAQGSGRMAGGGPGPPDRRAQGPGPQVYQ